MVIAALIIAAASLVLAAPCTVLADLTAPTDAVAGEWIDGVAASRPSQGGEKECRSCAVCENFRTLRRECQSGTPRWLIPRC